MSLGLGMFQGTVPTFLVGADGGSRFMGVARPSTFNVLDGNGTPLSPLGFATLTENTEIVDTILGEKRASAALAVGGTLGGVSMLVAGALEVRGAEAALASPAVAAASAKDAASDRLRGGAALLVAGGVVTFVSQFQAAMVRVKQSYMPSYFTGPELDAAIQGYNARLRVGLDLVEQDASDPLVHTAPKLEVRPRFGVGFLGLDGSF